MPVRPQTPAPDHRRVLSLALAVGVAGVLFTAVPAIDARLKTSFAERLARHAETLPAGAARLEVRRVAKCGLSAVAPLARLAGVPNAAAAAAARSALSNMVAGWESDYRSHRDMGLFSKRLQKLGESLDRWLLSYDRPTRIWADRLTLTIVRDADVLGAADAALVLENCDRILSAPPAVAVTAATPQKPAAPVQAAPQAIAQERAAATPKRTSIAIAPAIASPSVPAVAPPAMEIHVFDEPPAPRQTAASPTTIAPTPSDLVAAPDASLPAPQEAPLDASTRPLPAPRASDEVVDVPSPQQARVVLRRYRQMNDGELTQQLASATGFDARAIREVLRERHLPTAAGPSTPTAAVDPTAVERKILEQVSKLSPSRGRQLLRTLATDANEVADVRLQALALLATSGDPMLPAIARDRAVEDADPRVAELATRIMREQAAVK